MTKTNILTGILAIAVLTTVIGASTANQADAAHQCTIHLQKTLFEEHS